jgi:hypothetical protein
MKFLHKTLKFLSFSWALGLCVSLLCSNSFASAETEKDPFKDLPEKYWENADKCLNTEFLNKIKTVTPADSKRSKQVKNSLILEKLEPINLEENIQSKCSNNMFSRTGMVGVKHNLLDSTQKREVLKLGRFNEKKTVRSGACESSYEALFLTFKEAKDFRTNICKEFAEIQMEISDCVGTHQAEHTCISKLSKMIDSVKDLQERNSAALGKVRKFLVSHEKYTANAIKKFQLDSEVLTSLTPVQLAQPTYAGPRGTITASDFGALQLKEYLAMIGRGNSSISSELDSLDLTPTGKLIEEQVKAGFYLGSYEKQLADLFQFKGEDFTREISKLSEQLKKLELAKPDDSSWKKNLTDYGPGAVTAGQQFFQKTPGPASGLAGASALAALGAGAAIGSQVAGSRTSSSGSMPNPVPNVQNPVVPLENTILSKDTAPQNNSSNEVEAVTKTADPKTETNTEKTNAVIASTAPILSSGASFKQNGFKPKNFGKGETSAATPGKSDEALKPFGGELFSPPSPKKVDTSGDVSSLLGQMKDLFNFDDPAGGGMMPGAPEGFGEATPENLAATMGEQPFEEEVAGGEYTGEEDQGRQYASAEEEIIGSPLQQRAYLGGIETPLFKRVKNRHKKCMEKGLVILGLGRITE